MQWRISNKIQLGDILNPTLDYSGVPAVGNEANLESIYGKIDKIGGFGNQENQMRVWQDIFQIYSQLQLLTQEKHLPQ